MSLRASPETSESSTGISDSTTSLTSSGFEATQDLPGLLLGAASAMRVDILGDSLSTSSSARFSHSSDADRASGTMPESDRHCLADQRCLIAGSRSPKLAIILDTSNRDSPTTSLGCPCDREMSECVDRDIMVSPRFLCHAARLSRQTP